MRQVVHYVGQLSQLLYKNKKFSPSRSTSRGLCPKTFEKKGDLLREVPPIEIRLWSEGATPLGVWGKAPGGG